MEVRINEFSTSSLSAVYHCNDGYYYVKHKSDTTRVYLRCVKRDACECRASMPLSYQDRYVINFHRHGNHSHGPDLNLVRVANLRAEILWRCREEATDYRRIFDEECARVPAEVSSQLAFHSWTSSMYRARKELRESIPQSLTEYGEMLRLNARFGDTIDGEQLFKEVLSDPNGNKNVIFASPLQCSRLGNITEMHLDGTFKVVPRNPAAYQLLTVMTIQCGHAFPVFYVLMERKTQVAYTTVLNYIKEQYDQLQPSVIMTDFETGLQNAARAAYPEAHVVGCWFHSANAMNKTAKKLGHTRLLRTNNHAKKIVKMAMVLPLLPAEKVVEGYIFISQFAEETNLINEMRLFLQYIRRVWIEGVGAPAFSVYKQKRRTNNDMESYHRTLIKTMGLAHPDIWTFTDGLRKNEKSSCQKLMSLQNGLRAAREDRKAYVLSGKKIENATRRLDSGTYNVGDFLRVASYAIESVHNVVVNIESDDDENDNNDVGVHPDAAPLPPDADAPEPAPVQAQDPLAQEEVNDPQIPVIPIPPNRGRGRGARRGGGRGARRGGRRGGRNGGNIVENVNPEIQNQAGNVQPLHFLEAEWPEDEQDAQTISQRQLQLLQAVPLEDDPEVAGENDLVCMTCGVHKRAYIIERCMHFVMCATCVGVHRVTVAFLQGRPLPIRCPVCRAVVFSYKRIFQ